MLIRVASARMESNESASWPVGRARTIILTRPERSSERAAAFLSARAPAGVEILVSPLLEIVPLAAKIDLSIYSAVVFTSENAVRSVPLGSQQAGMPAFCIGSATAEAARKAGFEPRAAANSSNSLVALIEAQHLAGRLLYLRGKHAASDITGLLCSVGRHADEVVVYDQLRLGLNGPALDALECKQCILPVFSRRTAGILESEVRHAPDLGHAICCVSSSVAEAFRLDWTCRIAEEPTSVSLLSLALDIAAGT